MPGSSRTSFVKGEAKFALNDPGTVTANRKEGFASSAGVVLLSATPSLGIGVESNRGWVSRFAWVTVSE